LSNSLSENFENAQERGWGLTSMLLTGGMGLAGIAGGYLYLKDKPFKKLSTVGPDAPVTSADGLFTKYDDYKAPGRNPQTTPLPFGVNVTNIGEKRTRAKARHTTPGYLSDLHEFILQKKDFSVEDESIAPHFLASSVENPSLVSKPLSGSKKHLSIDEKLRAANLRAEILYTNTSDGLKASSISIKTSSGRKLAMPYFEMEAIKPGYFKEMVGDKLPASVAPKVRAYLNKLASSSKSSLASVHGFSASMPGVIRAGRVSGEIETFGSFFEDALAAIVSSTDNDLLREKRAESLVRFAGRAANMSSDLTGELSGREYGAVIDVTEYRMVNDSDLWQTLFNEGVFTGGVKPTGFKINGKDINSHGEYNSNLLGQILDWQDGKYVDRPMFNSERNVELIRQTLAAARNEDSGVFMSGTNTSKQAHGGSTTDLGNMNSMFDIFHPASRRTDEMYQQAVSSKLGSRDDAVMRGRGFRQGKDAVTIPMMADMALATESLEHIELGHYGFTTNAFAVLDPGQWTSNPNTMNRVRNAMFSVLQTKLGRVPTDAEVNEAITKGVDKTSGLLRTLRQGTIVYNTGDAVSNSVFQRSFSSSINSRIRVDYLGATGRPFDQQENIFVDLKRHNFMRKAIKQARASEWITDFGNTSTLTDEEIARDIAEGKYNHVFETNPIPLKQGESLFAIRRGDSLREVKVNKGLNKWFTGVDPQMDDGSGKYTGLFIKTIESDSFTSGAQIAAEESAHAVGHTVGTSRYFTGDLSDSGALLHARVLREGGRFNAEIFGKATAAPEMVEDVLRSLDPAFVANDDGKLQRITHKFLRSIGDTVKPLMGNSIVANHGPRMLGNNKESNKLGLVFTHLGELPIPDNIESTTQSISERLAVLQRDFFNRVRKLTGDDSVRRKLDDIQESLKIHTLEELAKGVGDEVRIDSRLNVFVGRNISVHQALKTTSALPIVSNVGQLGVFGHPRSARLSLNTILSATGKAAPHNKRATFETLLKTQVSGSRLNFIGLETAGLLQPIIAPESSMLDFLKTTFDNGVKGGYNRHLLDNIIVGREAIAKHLQQAIGPDVDLVDALRDAKQWINKGAIITPEQSGQMPAVLEAIFNTDNSFILEADNITESVFGTTAPVKEIYLGPTGLQPPGVLSTSEEVLGRLNIAKVALIHDAIAGSNFHDITTDNYAQSAYDIFINERKRLETSKSGLANALDTGVKSGYGGNLRVMSNEFFTGPLRDYAQEKGMGLAEDQMPLYLSETGGTPISSKGVSFLSEMSLDPLRPGSVGHQINRLGDTTPVYVDLGDGKRRIPIGSMRYQFETREPAPDIHTNIGGMRAITIHRPQHASLRSIATNKSTNGASIKQQLKKAQKASTKDYFKVLEILGIDEVTKIKDVLFADAVFQAYRNGDLDGDSMQVLMAENSMELSDELVREAGKSAASNLQGALEESHSRMMAGAYDKYLAHIDSKTTAEVTSKGLLQDSLGISPDAITGRAIKNLPLRKQLEIVQSHILQKVYTGSIHNRTHLVMDPIRDSFTLMFDSKTGKEFVDDPIAFNKLTLGANLSEQQLAKVKSAVAGSSNPAGIFLDAVDVVTHNTIQLPIAKGFSNAFFSNALLNTRHPKQAELEETYIRAVLGFKTSAKDPELNKIYDLVAQITADSLLSAKELDVTSIEQELLKDVDSSGRPYLLDSLAAGMDKAIKPGGSDMLDLLGINDRDEDTVEALSKIMLNQMRKRKENKLDVDVIMGKVKRGEYSLAQAKAIMSNQDYSTGSIRSGILMGLLGNIDMSTATSETKEQVQKFIDDNNKEYEAASSRPRTGQQKHVDDIVDASLKNHAAGKNRPWTDAGKGIKDLTGGVSNYLKAWMTDDVTEKFHYGEKASELLGSASSNLGRFLDSTTGKGAMVVAGLGAAAFGMAHVVGAMNSERVELPAESPLPRRIPLDDLKFDPAVYDTTPRTSVRLTNGETPSTPGYDIQAMARAELPTDSLMNQATIGVGTVIMDSRNSMGRTEYANYREDRFNSRF